MTAWFTKKKKTDRLKEILGDYELPRFRKTIFETLQRLREPAATSADIAEVMSLDPDLTSRVMRTVNSTAEGVITVWLLERTQVMEGDQGRRYIESLRDGGLVVVGDGAAHLRVIVGSAMDSVL